MMRRQFELLEEDLEFLENLGLPWESVVEGKVLWVLIHEYRLHPQYAQEQVSIAIHIPSGYPRAQLDMAYFFPAIQRVDGQPIGALAHRAIDGKTWQRWSRHRTGRNPWRDGVDNISTHFALVENWLEREFILRPYAVPA